MAHKKSKVRTTARSHYLPVQGYMETSQPVSFNNHQPRVGTKVPASKSFCSCSYCKGHSEKDAMMNNIVKKEISKEMDDFYIV